MSEAPPQLLIRVGENLFSLQIAPKVTGERSGVWSPEVADIAAAGGLSDGLLNTEAMAEEGIEIAQWAAGLSIDGHEDWYIPSRDELELLYRHYKPSVDQNYALRAGGNTSSQPVGSPYSEHLPAQTVAAGFRAGEAEAFDSSWYWSSTQNSPHHAWLQSFQDGAQSRNTKNYEGLVRAIRRELIS